MVSASKFMNALGIEFSSVGGAGFIYRRDGLTLAYVLVNVCAEK